MGGLRSRTVISPTSMKPDAAKHRPQKSIKPEKASWLIPKPIRSEALKCSFSIFELIGAAMTLLIPRLNEMMPWSITVDATLSNEEQDA